MTRCPDLSLRIGEKGPNTLFCFRQATSFVVERARGCGDDLIDAVVVEPNRHTAGREKDGDSVTDDHGPRMVHLEPLAAVQLHCEHAERLPFAQGLKDSIKIVGCHVRTLVKRQHSCRAMVPAIFKYIAPLDCTRSAKAEQETLAPMFQQL